MDGCAETISLWKFRAGFNRGAGWQCRLLLAHALSAGSGPAWTISIVGPRNDCGFLALPGRALDREGDRPWAWTALVQRFVPLSLQKPIGHMLLLRSRHSCNGIPYWNAIGQVTLG